MYVVLSRGTRFVVYPVVVRTDSNSFNPPQNRSFLQSPEGSRTGRPFNGFPDLALSSCHPLVKDRICVGKVPLPAPHFRIASADAGTRGMICGAPRRVNRGREKLGSDPPSPLRWSSSMRHPVAGPSRPLVGGVARRYNEFGGLLPRGQAQTIVFSDFSSWPRRTF
jgi:hypothetical protein